MSAYFKKVAPDKAIESVIRDRGDLKVLLDIDGTETEGCRVAIVDGDDCDGVGVILHDIFAGESALGEIRIGDFVAYKTSDPTQHPWIVAHKANGHWRRGEKVIVK